MSYKIPLTEQLDEFLVDDEISRLNDAALKLNALYKALGNLPVILRQNIYTELSIRQLTTNRPAGEERQYQYQTHVN